MCSYLSQTASVQSSQLNPGRAPPLSPQKTLIGRIPSGCKMIQTGAFEDGSASHVVSR